ncbi:uncharacterized protein A4U43_C07F9860 [Asparagus officinalis]|uniref:Uncharacterized protein n=1 Tax=Asparagus officinalis TaxID=4686 RepID=A0A5P1EAP7_ASPOF|nr:uncharacterized protein A4U43_C07F9860 [Asparagus officinalis]
MPIFFFFFFYSSEIQIFTVWMKSLVLNGNGCTIYDSYGRIVYRVYKYACKSSTEVYLMDDRGRTLTKILRKKLRIFRQWEGFQGDGLIVEKQEPWFRVRKTRRYFNRGQNFAAEVTDIIIKLAIRSLVHQARVTTK